MHLVKQKYCTNQVHFFWEADTKTENGGPILKRITLHLIKAKSTNLVNCQMYKVTFGQRQKALHLI
jgi:hypothetical protein